MNEEIKLIAQTINKGLLDSKSTEESVDYLLEGLRNALTEIDIAKSEVNEKFKVLPTNKSTFNFFKSIDKKDIIEKVKDLKGIALAKRFVELLLDKQEINSVDSYCSDSLNDFFNQLDS